MARSSGNSLINSLRGKIWISTSVLAFFICTFGLISYLVVTLLTNNPFYGVFIPFIFLAFSVIVFGWWLSNELVNPIDKVTLLAKSLERSSSTSIPKTSGSSETDQLLQTLHRNSMQMQNVVSLMDKVAGGNVDVALTPLEGSDRLTASFQKLLAKVSESIHAKEDLDKLEREVNAIKRQISGIRGGNLTAEISSDNVQTREIAETIKYLQENLTLLISLIKVDSYEVEDSASNVEKTIGSLIEQDENTIQKMNHASSTLKQVPNLIEKISEDLMRSAKSAKQTIDKTRHGTKISQENSETVSQLRSKLRESVSGMQNLNERSLDIAKVAKTVEDLANRTNMIALNASIQATEFGEDGRGFVLVSEELERLAARANGTNKQISMLNNAVISEIGKVETSLDTTMSEVAGLSKYAIETTNVLGELERYVGKFLNLQENLIAFSKDKSEETDEAFETFVSTISESERTIKDLKTSAAKIKDISSSMKNLQNHTTEFRILSEEERQELLLEPDEFTQEVANSEVDDDEIDLEANPFPKDDVNAAVSDEEVFDMNPEPQHLMEEEPATSSFDSDSFNTDELNVSNLDSAEFDSEELYAEEMQSLKDSLGELSSGEYHSNEFVYSEVDPEDQSTKEPQEEIATHETKSIENDEVLQITETETPAEDSNVDDLLNVTNDTTPDLDINLSA